MCVGRLLAEIGVGGHGHQNIVKDENQNWWCPTIKKPVLPKQSHLPPNYNGREMRFFLGTCLVRKISNATVDCCAIGELRVGKRRQSNMFDLPETGC